MQQAQVGRQMCQALMRVATGLMTCGAVANLDMPFNSESTRFEQRFAAFGFMQRPMPLVYEQFTTAMDVSGMFLITLSPLCCWLVFNSCYLNFSPVCC